MRKVSTRSGFGWPGGSGFFGGAVAVRGMIAVSDETEGERKREKNTVRCWKDLRKQVIQDTLVVPNLITVHAQCLSEQVIEFRE